MCVASFFFFRLRLKKGYLLTISKYFYKRLMEALGNVEKLRVLNFTASKTKETIKSRLNKYVHGNLQNF